MLSPKQHRYCNVIIDMCPIFILTKQSNRDVTTDNGSLAVSRAGYQPLFTIRYHRLEKLKCPRHVFD